MHAADIGVGTVVHHATVVLQTTRPLQVIDVTPQVAAIVRGCGLWDGLVSVQTQHTTTGVLLNEHEPLLETDLLAQLTRLVPDGGHAHDDFARRHDIPAGERRNGAAHLRAVLLAASETLAVGAGAVVLGRWQRLLFVECDGAQRRRVSVTCLGVRRHDRPIREAAATR